MVGRTRYSLPLSSRARAEVRRARRELDLRVLASARARLADADRAFASSDRCRRPRRAAFYALLPFRIARELRAFRPEAVLVQGARGDCAVLLGRTPGARAREGHRRAPRRPACLDPPLRLACAPPLGAAGDGSRASPFAAPTASGRSRPSRRELVARRGRRARGRLPGLHGSGPVRRDPPAPLPDAAVALFVGVLERYKNVEGSPPPGGSRRRACRARGFASSAAGRMRDVAERSSPIFPGAMLDAALTRPRSRRRWTRRRLLVLPSRSEGLAAGDHRGVLPRPA